MSKRLSSPDDGETRSGEVTEVFANFRFRIKVSLWTRLVRLLRWLLGEHLLGLAAATDQGLFLVDLEDYFVGGNLLRTGVAGGTELARLLSLVTAESRVLVVGTHIGTLAIPLARKVRQVQAFEANPATFEFLQANVRLSGLDNLEIFPLAASERSETLRFLQSRVNSGGSKRLPQSWDDRYYYDSPTTIEVQAVALDEHLEPADYDLVVMDIEGSEVFALRGMQRILARTQTLQVEFLPHHLQKVAGVTLDDFLEPILPYFERLQIPSKGLAVSSREAIRSALQAMLDADECDEGLLFRKAP